MIKLYINRLMELKGITRNKAAFLKKNGFSDATAKRLAYGVPKVISFRHIEKLCNVFNCTPNDLLVVTDGTAAALPENSALRALIKNKLPSITELVSDLSATEAEIFLKKAAALKSETVK